MQLHGGATVRAALRRAMRTPQSELATKYLQPLGRPKKVA